MINRRWHTSWECCKCGNVYPLWVSGCQHCNKPYRVEWVHHDSTTDPYQYPSELDSRSFPYDTIVDEE